MWKGERTSSDLLNGLSEACFGKVRQVGFLRALPPRQVSSLVSCAEQLIGLLRVGQCQPIEECFLQLFHTFLERKSVNKSNGLVGEDRR